MDDKENSETLTSMAQDSHGVEASFSTDADILASRIKSLECELAIVTQLSQSNQEALTKTLKASAEMRRENAKLHDTLKAANSERAELLQRLQVLQSAPVSADESPLHECSASKENDAIKKELSELYSKYEALREAKERSEAKHKMDYDAWQGFNKWLADTEPKGSGSIGPGKKLTEQNRKRLAEIRKKYDGSQLNTRPGTNGDFVMHKAATPPTNDFEQPNSGTSLVQGLVTPMTTGRPAKMNPPDERNEAPIPFVLKDVVPKLEQLPTSQKSLCKTPVRLGKRPRARSVGPSSSETEDDSQAPDPLRASQLIPRPRKFPQATPLTSSSSGLEPQAEDSKPVRDVFTHSGASPESVLVKPEPISPGNSPERCSKSPSKRELACDALTPNATPASFRTPKVKVSSSKENSRVQSVAASSGHKHHSDYSIYKGRGRYAVEPKKKAADASINALYEIDPANNDGRDFQYDEVVRNKAARKKLHAADCECCRNYYDEVGPLPPRPQAPLWRSPQSSPKKAEKATAGGSNEVFTFGDLEQSDEGRAQHIHDISRHRDQWGKGGTPPAFWDIGFPNTQEVAAINERAKDMHEQKRAMVEKEARQGGRFKRRKM